jgi:hypothetical protein
MVAILNMAATWIPDAVINFKLKSRQEEDKSTVFVKDLEKNTGSTVVPEG